MPDTGRDEPPWVIVIESRLLNSSLAVSEDSCVAVGASFCRVSATPTAHPVPDSATITFSWLRGTPWPQTAEIAISSLPDSLGRLGRPAETAVVVVVVVLPRLLLRLRVPSWGLPGWPLKFLRWGFLTLGNRGGSVPLGAQIGDSTKDWLTLGAK